MLQIQKYQPPKSLTWSQINQITRYLRLSITAASYERLQCLAMFAYLLPTSQDIVTKNDVIMVITQLPVSASDDNSLIEIHSTAAEW